MTHVTAAIVARRYASLYELETIYNMGDALDQLAKYASKDLFEKLKESYAKLIDFMINTDPSKGEIGISKNLDGLMELVKQLEGEIGKQLVKQSKRSWSGLPT